MDFIKNPNLPGKPAKVVVLDYRAPLEVKAALEGMDISIITTGTHPAVYAAISAHPDIMIHHVGEDRVVHAPGTDPKLLEALKSLGLQLIQGETHLTSSYPGTIPYNVARVGNLAFHNRKYTDPILLRELQRAGVELIHVNQGYAGCSVSVVDSTGFITGDKGIAAAAQRKGLEVLLLEDQKDIDLTGFPHGFIGGASGLIAPDRWCIAGDLDSLKEADRIRDFLRSRNIQAQSLQRGKVMDLGSLIPVMEASLFET